MKIKIKDIPKQGLDIEKQIQASEIDLQDEKEYKFDSPLSVSAHIEKINDVILADTKVLGKYGFSCARCLEPVSEKREDHFEISFDYDSELEEINLGEEIRQELIVALFKVVLCAGDCKGLCLSCGANLNKEKCKCLNAD